MKDDTDTITLDKAAYDELVEQATWADALDCAGVDNWGGYENAQQVFREMRAEQKKGEC